MLIICRYGEIALKGKNRNYFEHVLIKNIRTQLKEFLPKNIKRSSGKILIELPDNSSCNKITKILSQTFGIENFSFVKKTPPDIKYIKAEAIKLLETTKFKTFKVETKRSNKNFPLTSPQISSLVGEAILKKFKDKKVELKNPDVVVFIEVHTKEILLSLDKLEGPGGLPPGVSGKALSLLSGGIDSPVASFLAMKRGLHLDFVHFHALPFTPQEEIEKTKKLVQVLNRWQPQGKLILVPFADIQKEIFLRTKAAFRVILYRRAMFKIAERIARSKKASSLITGENLAQVASQTIENLFTIQSAINMLVIRPLIGFDKKEIIVQAKKIGTYEISILPYADCCVRFIPRHPATKTSLKEIEKEEAKLNLEKLIQQALNNTKALPLKAIR